MTSGEEKGSLVLKGIGVSPGIVRGKAFLYNRFDSQIDLYKLTEPRQISSETKRLKTALRKSEKELRELKKNLGHLSGVEPLYIIDVYIMILRDKAFSGNVLQNIQEKQVNAEWAVNMTLDRYRKMFEKVEDEYIRGRIADIQYVGQRILRHLTGEKTEILKDLGKDVIIVARDLSPADTAQFMIDKVLGFATDMGGKTSHTAIVAQAIEIPAVVGLETLTSLVKTDDDIILDGNNGTVIINPPQEIQNSYEDKKRLYLDARMAALQYAKLPAVTKDNHQVNIGGNIEFIEEIASAVAYGAEGIGLYRTEFIYINRTAPPSEEEHFNCYRRIIGIDGLSWSTIRTFDLGGDKIFTQQRQEREANPQLGLRAIRFCLREQEIFRVQLRAIIRASRFGKTKVLFPMISSIEELREAKRIYQEVRAELMASGTPIGEDVKIGVMIEVPSAVIIADKLAREVDFFSIGTNDLIQYALAIDRVNEKVTYLYEPLHPAVLRMLKQVVEAGHRAGIPVAMCGEMAGEPLYTLILLGLGLDEMSMNPLAMPQIKRIIRGATMKESRRLLREVLNYASAEEIRGQVFAYMKDRFPEVFSLNTH